MKREILLVPRIVEFMVQTVVLNCLQNLHRGIFNFLRLFNLQGLSGNAPIGPITGLSV